MHLSIPVPRWVRGAREVFGSAGASPSRRGATHRTWEGEAPAEPLIEFPARCSAQPELRPPEGMRLSPSRWIEFPARCSAQRELRPPEMCWLTSAAPEFQRPGPGVTNRSVTKRLPTGVSVFTAAQPRRHSPVSRCSLVTVTPRVSCTARYHARAASGTSAEIRPSVIVAGNDFHSRFCHGPSAAV